MRANPFPIRFIFGFLKPKTQILGVDMAGVIESVGSNVTQFQPGDEVFGCLSKHGGQTFAEYVCAGENEITLKPSNISFEQAAAVPLAAMTALQGLQAKGNIHTGQKVLIQGASGGVGMFAVQIAKSFGAEVTAVCSTRNQELARNFGADYIIDYKKEDFAHNGQHYDLILAANGYHPISDYLSALSPDGFYVVTGGSLLQFIQALYHRQKSSKNGNQKIINVTLRPNQKDLIWKDCSLCRWKLSNK
jgi:NADPH:quinone reductase-like Zn-dependent oxidoreductase